MGFFNRPPTPDITARRHPAAVTVEFAYARDPDALKAARQVQGYAYWWFFTLVVLHAGGSSRPRSAWGPGLAPPTPSTPKPAIVAKIGTRWAPNGRALSSLTRIIPGDEIHQYRTFEQAISADNLEPAVHHAALYPDPTPTTPSTLLPFDGDARADMAGDYAHTWWKASKRAEERGLPAPEVEALHRGRGPPPSRERMVFGAPRSCCPGEPGARGVGGGVGRVTMW